MTTTIKTIIESELKGTGFKDALNAFVDLEKVSAKTGIGLETMAGAAATVGTALAVVGSAADLAIDSIVKGAALDAATEKFDKLSKSIGTTADVLLGEMQTATRGMVSDANLIASATDIINLGLGKSKSEVVRLARVVGELGLDMNQLTLTLANDSTQRLDSLGLSIEGVNKKMEELKARGVDATEAFDLAVLESLEDKLDTVGVSSDSAAASLKILQASYENVTNAFASGAAQAASEELSALGGSAQASSKGLAVLSEAAGKSLVNTLLQLVDPMNTTQALLVKIGNNALDAEDDLRTFGRTSASTGQDIEQLNEKIEKSGESYIEATRRRRALAEAYDRNAEAAQKVAEDTKAKAEADKAAAEAAEEHARAMQRQAEEMARVNATTGDYFTTISSGGGFESFIEYGLQAADVAGANALQLAAYAEKAGLAEDASQTLGKALGQAAADAAAADFAQTGDLDAYLTRLQEIQNTVENFPSLDELLDQQNRILPQMEEDPFFRIKEDTPAALQLLEDVTTAGVTGFTEMTAAAGDVTSAVGEIGAATTAGVTGFTEMTAAAGDVTSAVEEIGAALQALPSVTVTIDVVTRFHGDPIPQGKTVQDAAAAAGIKQ